MFGGTEGNHSDMSALVLQQEVTLLSKPIAAKLDHALCIEEDYSAKYGPRADIVESLRKYAMVKVNHAWKSISQNGLDEAVKLCDRALIADDHCLDALLVKAVVYRLKGSEDFVAVQRDSAKILYPEIDFDQRIKQIMQGVAPVSEVAYGLRQALMVIQTRVELLRWDLQRGNLQHGNVDRMLEHIDRIYPATADATKLIEQLQGEQVQTPRERSRTNKTVLMAEDNDELRTAIVLWLQERGWHVLDAADAETVLQLVESYDSDIDVAILDWDLPQVADASPREKFSSIKLARKLKNLHADIKMLFISGWRPGDIEGFSLEEFLQEGHVFLLKPSSFEELENQLQNLMKSGVK